MPGATVTNAIIEVWQENLEEEFSKMRDTVLNYHYIAMVILYCMFKRQNDLLSIMLVMCDTLQNNIDDLADLTI